MQIEDSNKVVHGTMPLNDGNEDGSVDAPRRRGVLARVAEYRIILAQLTESKQWRLIDELLDLFGDTDPRLCGVRFDFKAEPFVVHEYREEAPTHDWVVGNFKGNAVMQEYLALVPTLGPPPDAKGIDRIVARMIDSAAGDGGPFVRVGNTLLGGDAGPRFGADSTPTERIVHLLLFNADRNRELLPGESNSLWERQEEPLQAKYRTMGWLQERVGGSSPTLYDALRKMHARGVTEQVKGAGRSGMLIRLRVPYTFQAAEDRAMYCHLRDEGLLPVTGETVVPGETRHSSKEIQSKQARTPKCWKTYQLKPRIRPVVKAVQE